MPMSTKLSPIVWEDMGWPEYHSQGMGCGLEDRGIRDRYAAMQHGWDKCEERFAEMLDNAGPVYEAPPADSTAALKKVLAMFDKNGMFVGTIDGQIATIKMARAVLFQFAEQVPTP